MGAPAPRRQARLPCRAADIAYRGRVPPPQDDRPHLELTRRGRLLRSVLVLVVLIALVVAVTAIVRAVAGQEDPPSDAASSLASTAATRSVGPSDAGGASAGGGAEPADGAESSTPAAETPAARDAADSSHEEIRRSGNVGEGTWTAAVPADDPGPEADTVHTYTVRVEDGIDLDAEEVADEIEGILADDRGWSSREGVAFEQVASGEDADFTISLASPPTADELCLPADTGGLWNCRVGADVVLNSDRWQLMTPTYDDLPAYRAYMVNHEVGHFLGRDHASCGGEGEPAPVMLQQSMGLHGCEPNSWPLADEES